MYVKPSALVVEDDETIREALMITLEGEGYVARGVASLSEAREALAGHSPTVVVLDLMLPDGRGDELLDELATRSDAPPTVLVSASPDAPAVARRFGIACMTKPFDLDHLLAMLQAAIAQQRVPGSTPPPST
jgi:two-component system, OmpR family, KDP operon response regulator KdpE